MCSIIRDSSRGVCRGGAARLTEEIIAVFDVRKQYIALAEAFAPLLALQDEGRL